MSDQSTTTVAAANDNTSLGPDPSANALRHGLSAKKFLPKVLQPGRLVELLHGLRNEYRPKTITEEILMREIARHAAALEVTEEAEPAVLRIAAQGLAQFADLAQAASDVDLLLATAITTEPLDRAARYRRMHERGLQQSIDKLHSLQAARAAEHADGEPDVVSRFSSEDDCESYLRARFARQDWRCPRCGGSEGCCLAKRKVWQCTDCGAQFGLRHGTVFARSALPLTAWFAAISTFAENTSITATELMTVIGVTRAATAQSMLRRIRRAVAEGDVNQGLAGLTAYAMTCKS
jgi:transposase-like protein